VFPDREIPAGAQPFQDLPEDLLLQGQREIREGHISAEDEVEETGWQFRAQILK